MGRAAAMTPGRIGKVLRYLRGVAAVPATAESSDGQLLERCARECDGAALQTLVQRHGGLVMGVCRRLVPDPHAAEDAFQATFLVLVRKARSLDRRGSLAGWLYGVAYRIALRARAHAQRRRQREQQVVTMNEFAEASCAPTEPLTEASRRELRAVLDEELQRLPARYREALILCYLEGKSNEQAARELGWPAGSMSRHLARGRELLQERLAQRGVAVAVGLLGAVVAESAAATVPPVLADQLVQSGLQLLSGHALGEVAAVPVVTLTEGALRAMTIYKLQLVACVLAVGLLGMATGVFLFPKAVARPLPTVVAPVAETQVAADPPRSPVVLHHEEAIQTIALAPNGRLIATLVGTNIHVWDAAQGKELRRLALPGEKSSEAFGLAGRLAFTPDGRSLAWLGRLNRTHDGVVIFWNVATGEKIRTLQDPQNGLSFTCLAISPDGKLAAVGAVERTIVLWDLETGKEVRRLSGRETHALAFAPDGKTLASARTEFFEKRNGVFLPVSGKEFLFLWDVATGKEIRAWEGHPRGAMGVAFSADGRVLASVGEREKAIRLWEVASGKEIRVCPHPEHSSGGTVRVNALRVGFSPDGSLLSLGNKKGLIRFWDVLAGVQDLEWKPGEGQGTADFAPLANGRTLSTRYAGRVAVVDDVSELIQAAQPQAIDLTAGEVAALWDDLGSQDAPKACRALARLAAGAEKAVPFLHERFRALPVADLARARRLAADLGNEKFEVRQAAAAELETLGEAARPALQKALDDRPPLEVQRRLESLLEKLAGWSGDQLRLLRAIQALEYAGTPAARKALEPLAQGAAGPRLAAEARASLQRLAQRPESAP